MRKRKLTKAELNAIRSRNLVKARRALKAKVRANKHRRRPPTRRTQDAPDSLTTYALGHVTAWLEIYSASHRLSFPDLANRVGALLQHPAGG